MAVTFLMSHKLNVLVMQHPKTMAVSLLVLLLCYWSFLKNQTNKLYFPCVHAPVLNLIISFYYTVPWASVFVYYSWPELSPHPKLLTADGCTSWASFSWSFSFTLLPSGSCQIVGADFGASQTSSSSSFCLKHTFPGCLFYGCHKISSRL